MSSLTVCPECQKQVAVPDGTHLSAQVRCPLCEAPFTLADSIPDDVPEVVIVDPGFADDSTAVLGALATGSGQAHNLVDSAIDAGEQTGDAVEQFGDLVQEEAGEVAGSMEEVAEEATDKIDDLAAQLTSDSSEETLLFEGVETKEAEDAEEASPFSFDAFSDSKDTGKSAETDESEAGGLMADEGLGTATAESEKAGAGSDFDFGPGDAAADFAAGGFAAESGDGEGEDGAGTATAARPTSKKGIGLKGQVIGIVVFGVIGLALGYGILKLVKPAATAPIDKILGDAWGSVASLWSSDEPAEKGTEPSPSDIAKTSGSGEAKGSDSGQGDFAIGAMLPDNGKSGKKKKNKGKQKNQPFDPMPPGNEDIFGPPANNDTRTFAALLAGQSDPTGALLEFDADQIAGSLAGAFQATDEPTSKLSDVYFAMCDLGHRLAHAADGTDPTTSNHRTDAENLIRQLATPKKHASLSGFSLQWLQFDKRPPAHKNNRGVFLVGKVQRIVPMGSFFATELEMSKTVKDKDGNPMVRTSRIVAVSPERPDLHVHDMAGVLGSVVLDAPAKLPGYDPQTDLKELTADPNVIILTGAATKLPKS